MKLLKQQTSSTASTAGLELRREGREPERHQIVFVNAILKAKRSFRYNIDKPIYEKESRESESLRLSADLQTFENFPTSI